MTEKQFKQLNDGIKDTETDGTLTRILKFALELKELNDFFDCVFDRNRQLEKENKQLKSLLDCSREEANDYCEELMGKDEFVRLYKKENEQLKKENKKLIDLMDSEIQKNAILSEKNNSLKIKNMRLEKQNKYKQPSCKYCIYFATDGTGNYCMNEKGLLGEKGEMFPFTWSYKKGAEECNQYSDEKELFNELINLIKDIIFETKYEQSYSTPICKVSFFVTPEMYKILSEKMKEVNK